MHREPQRGDASALARVGAEFAHLAATQFRTASPLYARLARGIAADPEMLALAATGPPGQRALLFLGAVQYLLLTGVPHPVRAFYPSLGERTNSRADPYPPFRAFCLEQRAALLALIATRRVQTNEVQRCACLLPAFALASRWGRGRPLALIEIGASAGLNLLWDRYHYTYEGGGRCGPADAPMELSCRVHGRRLPLPRRLPPVATRLGLDLHPLDVRDPDTALWLRALVWPEHTTRVALLAQAIALAQGEPPAVQAGDALELLPAALAALDPEALACVYHSHVLYQWPPAARVRLSELLVEAARTQPLVHIALEWGGGDHSTLSLDTLGARGAAERLLARCDAHGQWIAWHAAGAT